MKAIIKLTLGIILLLCSCVKEDFTNTNNVPEGERALVSLKMSPANMGSGERTKSMTSDRENEIMDIRVMIFDNSGNIVTNNKYIGSHTSIDVETYSGNSHNIYIVANAVSDLDQRIQTVSSLSQLLALHTTIDELGYSNGVDRPLVMTGSLKNVDIRPGTSSIDAIQLDFIAAKLTMNVIDATNHTGGEKITVLSWDMVDVAKNTFVYQGSNNKDANYGLEGNNDAWLTTDDNYSFTPDKLDPLRSSMEIYLTENRRGGRIARSLPANTVNRYPNMGFYDNDHRGKSWFKPPRATAINIRAMYQNSAGKNKLISAQIYIGNNNHSNYDIVRGCHYTFTVTFRGVNDISVDSNVDYAVTDFRVDHGTNLIMDSHPDFRPIRILAPHGRATIEIVDDAGRVFSDSGFSATWLKISPLNLMCHQVRQSGDEAYWQQDAGVPGSFVRAKYIPHKSARANLSGKGGWNMVPAGKEDDDVMQFSDATYRMCYKITDIPFDSETSIENKTLYVYADEFLNDDGSRKATVRVSFYKDNSPFAAEVIDLPISQLGYISVYENVIDAGLVTLNEDGTPGTGSPKKFIIEQTEEYSIVMNPGEPLSVQRIYAMQWGFKGFVIYTKEDRYRNGYFLTANAVYNDVTRLNNEPTGFGLTNNSYRPFYGNNITGGTSEIPNYTGTTAAPYYYPKATDVIYHPIYKSSAARYCHEKNRDLNGDGIIDSSETKWYLPSLQEMMMLWIAGKQVYLSSAEFWTVSEESIYGCWSFSPSATNSLLSRNLPNTNTLRVRCVRVI